MPSASAAARTFSSSGFVSVTVWRGKVVGTRHLLAREAPPARARRGRRRRRRDDGPSGRRPGWRRAVRGAGGRPVPMSAGLKRTPRSSISGFTRVQPGAGRWSPPQASPAWNGLGRSGARAPGLRGRPGARWRTVWQGGAARRPLGVPAGLTRPPPAGRCRYLGLFAKQKLGVKGNVTRDTISDFNSTYGNY